MSVGPTKPKGQHFLPRFLLGRFASRTKRGQSYVFLFRRGERQVEANVSNVAKARYFYGDPATSALEEKLAGEESVWASLVERLVRTGEVLGPDVSVISNMVVNLTVRGRNFRDGTNAAFEKVFSQVEDSILALPRQYLRSELEKMLPGVLENPEVRARVGHLSNDQRRLLLDTFARIVPWDSAKAAAVENFRVLRSMASEQQIVANSHRNSLYKLFEGCARAEDLATLEWRVERATCDRMILGDVATVGRAAGSSTFQNVMTLEGVPALICLPISSDAVLVGSQIGCVEPLDFRAINLASVELSRSFFVSSQNSQMESAYRERLGDRSELLTEEDIESWKTESA